MPLSKPTIYDETARQGYLNELYKYVAIMGAGSALADPGADRILFWDDSAGTLTWLTASTGLAISGTNLSLSHLGLENLSDPGADRIAFWDDSEGALKWLDLGVGLQIGTVLGGPGLALDNDVEALEAMSGTGLVTRTASETYAQRTIAGTSNQITVSNGSGVSGNPTLSLPVGNILTGQYNPALTNTTNISASSGSSNTNYIRIGTQVIVAGRVSIDAITAGSQVVLGMSLPIASNIGVTDDVIGVAMADSATDATFRPLAVIGDVSNNRATVQGVTNQTGNTGFSIIFMYTII